MEIFSNRRLSVELVDAGPAGSPARQKIVIHPGDAVVILPYCGESSWYLIRQYRFAIDKYILEAPAGTMEEGETPEETAQRELIEETGFKAGTLIGRGTIYSTPGFTDEQLHLFEARDLSLSDDHQMDEDEEIDLVRVTEGDLVRMCIDGRVSDAKTISIVYRCLGDRT